MASCRASIKRTEKINPNRKMAALYDRQFRVYDKLYDDLKERFQEISEIEC